MAVTRNYIYELADGIYDSRLREAFLDSISNIASRIDIERLAMAIETRHIETAAELVQMVESDFAPLHNAIQEAVGAGGQATSNALPSVIAGGQRIKLSFNPGSRRAMEAVESLHTNLIREVRESTRTAIKDHIRTGLEFGKNPRATAREIRGVYDYAQRRYRGGVIGLTEKQEGWVTNAERQLRSGDRREMRKYLSRKLRDRRHDRTILKAINEGTPLPEGTIRKATLSYRRRTIKYRAETIARDQSLEALSKGQDVAMGQHIDTGSIQEKDVLQFWLNAGDKRVRDSHRMVPVMNRQGVRRGRHFLTPLGPLLRPRDRSSPGSLPENVIQCRCSLSIRIRRQA